MKAMQVIPPPSTPAHFFPLMHGSCEGTGPRRGALVCCTFRLSLCRLLRTSVCSSLEWEAYHYLLGMYNSTGPRVSS